MTQEIIKIDNTTEEAFQITWDVGRRCNYDCTYCPSHRHDNFSKHASYEKLVHTFNFVKEYFDTINQYVINEQHLSLSLTGGEPTNNPNLLNLFRHIKKYDQRYSKHVSITSNGTFSEKYCNELTDMEIGVTVSYHCEADAKLKSKIVERIYQLSERKYRKPKINLMFHANEDYFRECVELANRFLKDGIKFSPRIIGEGGDKFPYAHSYTKEQHKILKDFWRAKNESAKGNLFEIKPIEYKAIKDEEVQEEQTNKLWKKDANTKAINLGRPCCGGRTFCTKNTVQETDKATFVPSTRFKGWKCLVNWHWLHIEQQTDEVYHHQTCQATFNTNRGSIGTIAKSDVILDKLKKQLATGHMPVIVCSKEVCGCGLCLSKAKNDDDLKDLFSKTVKGLQPLIGETLY
jgi:MoaA/NifB/PqqE/SkfB family radical SAM enzyme